MSSTASQHILLSAAEVEIQATDGKSPSVSIVAYTGGLRTVPGWGPVAIDLAGLDATAEQISLLADHDSSLNGIVGHGQAAVTGGKLLVNGTITGATEAARQVAELARGGFKFQASVGVAPRDYECVRAGDTVQINGRAISSGRSGFTLVKAGVLREVSIVAIGADANTSVSIAAQGKESIMNETLTADDIGAAALVETERVHAIRTACGGQFGDIEARAIVEGWDVRRKQLKVLRASRPQVTSIHARSFAPTRQTLEAAVLGHMGYEHLAERHLGATAAQQARDLDIRPRVLLVPPELQQTAKELLMSDSLQRANNDVPTGNALKNAVTPEVEPRLSNAGRFGGTSAKAWYLFAGPADTLLIVAFLHGHLGQVRWKDVGQDDQLCS